MSDGGGDTIKEAENSSINYRLSKKKRSGVVDFTHSIARVAVAQICEDAGFQGFQRSALDAISDMAVRYIREIGRTASLSANLACRSQCNVFDIIHALEDLGSVQGFSSASDVHHCLSGSGVVRELCRYIGEAEEIPFAYSIPEFPVLKQREPPSSFALTGVEPPGEHIPSWLPIFPAPETYANSHLGHEKAQQVGEGEGEPVEKDKDDSRVLTNLQPKLTCNGTEPSVAVNFGNAAKGKRSLECNPFLAPPVQPGEKEEVSPVAIPAKLLDEVFIQDDDNRVLDTHISVLDIFAPTIEGLNSGPNIDSGNVKQGGPLNRSSTVSFKFFDVRKSFHKRVNLQKQEFSTTSSWFASDDAKDDQKRRAEQILKQSFECAGSDSFVN